VGAGPADEARPRGEGGGAPRADGVGPEVGPRPAGGTRNTRPPPAPPAPPPLPLLSRSSPPSSPSR
jgi:hypothetical protein